MCILPTLLRCGVTQADLPHLQIQGGLARFRGDADADVGAALGGPGGGHVGGGRAGVKGSLLRGQDVSLPPEVRLVDLHGLTCRLCAILQVLQPSEERPSLRNTAVTLLFYIHTKIRQHRFSPGFVCPRLNLIS